MDSTGHILNIFKALTLTLKKMNGSTETRTRHLFESEHQTRLTTQPTRHVFPKRLWQYLPSALAQGNSHANLLQLFPHLFPHTFFLININNEHEMSTPVNNNNNTNNKKKVSMLNYRLFLASY
jgi:hypothetical protein